MNFCIYKTDRFKFGNIKRKKNQQLIEATEQESNNHRIIIIFIKLTKMIQKNGEFGF